MKGKVATSLLAIPWLVLVTVDRKTKLVLRTGFRGQVALLYIFTLTMTLLSFWEEVLTPVADFPFGIL